MVWGAFSARGKSKLVFEDGNVNSAKYIEYLSSFLYHGWTRRTPDVLLFNKTMHLPTHLRLSRNGC